MNAFRHVIRERRGDSILAEFAGESNGSLTVTLYDDQAQPRGGAVWPASENAPRFFLLDSAQLARSALQIDMDQHWSLAADIEGRRFRLRSWLGPGESIGFILMAETELRRAAIAVGEDGIPFLQLFDSSGKLIGRSS